MAYGKSDFIDFSDIDLTDLLGEYTCSEVDSDEDSSTSVPPSSGKDDNLKSVSRNKCNKIYQCDKCDKMYSTVSVLRGHLKTKNGVSNIRASEYRHPREPQTQSQTKPFCVSEDHFESFFKDSLVDTLTIMKNNKLRRTSSANGRNIITVTESILLDKSAHSKLVDKLCQPFYQIFKQADERKSNVNEALFSSFYALTEEEELIEKLMSIASKAANVASVRQFVGVLLHSLIKTMIKKRADLFEVQNENEKPLNDNDQTVIFYTSGYIIYSLSNRKVTKSQSEKVNALQSAMNEALLKENSHERTFVTKYSGWTQKLNRGGLKIPSDNFYLLIREFEICCREVIKEKKISSMSFSRTVLTESIMDRFMVKHYADKLFKGPYTSFVLECCVKLFLTICGHAWAKKRSNEDNDEVKSSKALRRSQKEYSNVQP